MLKAAKARSRYFNARTVWAGVHGVLIFVFKPKVAFARLAKWTCVSFLLFGIMLLFSGKDAAVYCCLQGDWKVAVLAGLVSVYLYNAIRAELYTDSELCVGRAWLARLEAAYIAASRDEFGHDPPKIHLRFAHSADNASPSAEREKGGSMKRGRS